MTKDEIKNVINSVLISNEGFMRKVFKSYE